MNGGQRQSRTVTNCHGMDRVDPAPTESGDDREIQGCQAEAKEVRDDQ